MFLSKKYVTVALPEKIYNKLKELKRNGEIVSISSFIRHLVYLALNHYPLKPSITYTRRITIEEEYRVQIPKREETRQAIYGKHTAEIMKQLKSAIAERRKKLKNMDKSITKNNI